MTTSDLLGFPEKLKQLNCLHVCPGLHDVLAQLQCAGSHNLLHVQEHGSGGWRPIAISLSLRWLAAQVLFRRDGRRGEFRCLLRRAWAERQARTLRCVRRARVDLLAEHAHRDDGAPPHRLTS